LKNSTIKLLPGRGGATEKIPKIANKLKNSTIKPLPEGTMEKDQKIALLSLY